MELAANSIRLVQAQQGSSGYQVARSAEVEFPPNVYQDGQIFDPKGFRAAMKEALRGRMGGAGRSAVMAVGAQHLLVRRVPLPKLKRNDLRHLLETQGDQWIPFLREGAAFEVVVINPNLNEHQQEVLLVAVPLRFVEYAHNLLQAAGLKLAALDVDVSAVYRAAVLTAGAPASGAVAVLDLSKEKPRLGFYHDGLLVAARTLETRVPRPALGGEAPAIRFGGDFPIEVRRTVELLMTPLPEGTALNAVVLLDPQSDPALQEELGRELTGALQNRLGSDFRLFATQGPGLAPNQVQSFGLSLVTGGSPTSFNLMPRPTVKENRQRRLSTILSLLLIAGLGGYAFLWTLQMPGFADQWVLKQRTLNNMKEQLAREQEVALEERKAEALAPLLAQLDQYDNWSVVHPRLKSLLPPGVRISSVVGAMPNLNITGTAPDPDRVAEFVNALDESPYFHNLVLSSSGTNPGTVQFSLSITVAKREVKEQ
ncbi:MAG: pilus assembly protein PilM [Bacillota bacterium]